MARHPGLFALAAILCTATVSLDTVIAQQQAEPEAPSTETGSLSGEGEQPAQIPARTTDPSSQTQNGAVTGNPAEIRPLGGSLIQAAVEDNKPDEEFEPEREGADNSALPNGELDVPPDQVDDRINQTLKDAGAILPEEIDPAYGAFQRGYFLTALAIAIEEAKKGDVAAQTLLGELLSRGLGIKSDPEEAAGWYALAAEAGDDEAQYALGLMHLDGRGVEKDIGKAAELFKQAADNGNVVALRELAFLLLKGDDLESRPMLAAAYLRRAAGAGDGDAQFALGGLYSEGVGVAQSDVESARWYGEAARNGHIPGQIEYAIALFNGRGVSKDEGRAAGWFRQAARTGNPVAQARLARLLSEGRGTDKNEREAARWYLIAKRSGLTDDFMEDWLLSLDADVRQSVEEQLDIETWPAASPEPGRIDGDGPQNAAVPADSEDDQPEGTTVTTTTVEPPLGGLEQSVRSFGSEPGQENTDSQEDSRPRLPSPVDILEE